MDLCFLNIHLKERRRKNNMHFNALQTPWKREEREKAGKGWKKTVCACDRERMGKETIERIDDRHTYLERKGKENKKN